MGWGSINYRLTMNGIPRNCADVEYAVMLTVLNFQTTFMESHSRRSHRHHHHHRQVSRAALCRLTPALYGGSGYLRKP